MRWSKEHLPSRYTTEGVENAFHRVFYYAMGLSTEEIHQPHVGVVTAWDDSTAVHDDVRAVAERVKSQLWGYDLTPREFTTIPGFDGHDARSEPLLVSRELIADSVELTVRGHCYDALVGIAASPLALAGLAMAAYRLDTPCVIVPVTGVGGGDRDGIDAMVAAVEALGLTDPSSVTGSTREIGDGSAAALADRLASGARPRATSPLEAFERAAVAALTITPSIDPLLHLVALASERGLELDLPGLLSAATSGEHAREGRPQVALLTGPLAPGGAVALRSASSPERFSGPARVSSSEAEACRLVESGALGEGEVLVLRGQGPAGGPGMPSCHRLVALLEQRAGQGGHPVVVTDGRAPSGRGVTVVCAVTPEASAGGPLGTLSDGAVVDVDLADGTIDSLDCAAGQAWPPDPSTQASPVLWKYAAVVDTAMAGARTHPGAAAEQHCYADL